MSDKKDEELGEALAIDDRYSTPLFPENYYLRVQWLKEMGMIPDDDVIEGEQND